MDSMTLKLGQVQLMVGRDKAENLRRACALIRRAAEQGAQLVMLPEMFCCPYENEMFRPNSEEQGGPAQQALSALSRELGIWIVGGTIPEREGKRLYNTCYVYDDQGRQAARHRKIHLFDVNVEGDSTSWSPTPSPPETTSRCWIPRGAGWGYACASTCGSRSCAGC